MLQAYTGLQRSGKTYIAVQELLEIYLDTKRHIYTNLPITEHFLAQKPERAIDVTLFCNSLNEAKIIKRRTGSFFRAISLKYLDKRFFQKTISGSWFVIDEAYEIFRLRGYKDKNEVLNDNLLSYLKQHGHFGDDITIITHDLRDVERIIRTSFQRVITVTNTKYQSLYPKFPLCYIKTPFQMFCKDIQESDSSKRHFFFPNSDGFLLYDSFCQSRNVAKASKATSDLRIAQDEKPVQKLKIPVWILILFIVGIPLLCYRFYTRFFPKEHKKTESQVVKIEKIEEEKKPVYGHQWARIPDEKRTAAGVENPVELPPPRDIILEYISIETRTEKGLDAGLELDSAISYALSWEVLAQSQFNPVQALAFAITAKTKLDASKVETNVLSRVTHRHVIGTTSKISVGDTVNEERYIATETGTTYQTTSETRDYGRILSLTSRAIDDTSFVLDVQYLDTRRISVDNYTRSEYSYTAIIKPPCTVSMVSFDTAEKSQEYQQGIPLLCDIPFAGYLFRVTKNRNMRSSQSAVIIARQATQ